MRLAIIVTDANGLVHAGLDVVRHVKMFELPEEIETYIRQNTSPYVSVSFGLDEDAKDDRAAIAKATGAA